MKKGLVLFAAVLILASFFVIADSDNSVTVKTNAQIGDDSANMNANAEMQQEMNENQYENQYRYNSSMNGTNMQYEYQLRERHELNDDEKRNILRAENQLRARLNQSECPVACECEGSSIKCEIQEGNQTRREMTIHAGNSGNMIIQVKDANASTQVQLYKSADGKVYGNFKDNQTHAIILPDEARARLMTQERLRLQNESINLTEDGEYHIQAQKRARLFFVIPVKEQVKAQVDAETGEVVRVRNSWWGFLAKDVNKE